MSACVKVESNEQPFRFGPGSYANEIDGVVSVKDSAGNVIREFKNFEKFWMEPDSQG